MDATPLQQGAYIKTAVLQGRNARECHSELVEAVGNNALLYRKILAFSSISSLQYGYFDVGTLF
jgi:hypothetical protein